MESGNDYYPKWDLMLTMTYGPLWFTPEIEADNNHTNMIKDMILGYLSFSRSLKKSMF